MPLSTQEVGLMIISQSMSPDSFLPHYCRAFQRRCTMMSFSNSIKGGAHLNLGHFLLVSLCVSIMESSECIPPGKGAFPSVASISIVEAVLLFKNLVSMAVAMSIMTPYDIINSSCHHVQNSKQTVLGVGTSRTEF